MSSITREVPAPCVTSQRAVSPSTVFNASSFPGVPAQDLSEEEGRELSPGLIYLEQVCQTLEEFARQQMNRQAAGGLHEHGDVGEEEVVLSNLVTISVLSQSLQQHDTADFVWLPSGLRINQTVTFSSSAAFQDPDGSLRDSLLPAADDVIVCLGHTLEGDSAQARSSEPQRRKDYQRHFRQRSVSDANLATLHLSESQFATVDFLLVRYSSKCCTCVWCYPVRPVTVMGFIVVFAGELNKANRGQQRLGADDLLLKLTGDFQKQVKEKTKKHWQVTK